MFHVSSVANRASIAEHGLDWTRMGAARGIAGSTRPEVDGIFLCGDDLDIDFFVRLNNTGAAVDVWSVEDVDPNLLVTTSGGWSYLAEPIAPTRLRLVRRDLPPRPEVSAPQEQRSGAFTSSLTITFEDGTVLSGGTATEFARRHRS